MRLLEISCEFQLKKTHASMEFRFYASMVEIFLCEYWKNHDSCEYGKWTESCEFLDQNLASFVWNLSSASFKVSPCEFLHQNPASLEFSLNPASFRSDSCEFGVWSLRVLHFLMPASFSLRVWHYFSSCEFQSEFLPASLVLKSCSCEFCFTSRQGCHN